MAEPRVSILVPTFNAGPFLRQALDSLVEQRLTDVEFVCINDGSTDDSPAVLEEYARRDSRFVIHHKTNSGYGASMNIGLDLARGRYVGILEPDDFASPLMFEHLSEAALEHDAQVVKAGYRAFQTEAGLAYQDVRLFNPKLTGHVLRPVDHPAIFRARPAIWAGIYERAFLEEKQVRFLETPGASYQDAGFNFKVMASAERALLVDRHFLHYRTDNVNSSVKDRGKIWAVKDEYDSIAAFIDGLPHRDRLFQIMQGTRFESYRWNLERLDPEVRSEFFEHVYETYSTANEDSLVQSMFNGNNWVALGQLRNEPNRLRDNEHVLRPVLDAPVVHSAATASSVADKDAKTSGTGQLPGLVSVIIPVFNAERHLADCLDSVLTQTYENLEVICVDDGSTDSSAGILELYASHDPRVRVLTQANAGAGVARNAGVDIARGEYLSFLDADDVFDARMLELARAAAVEHDLDITVYRAAWFTSDAPHVRRPIKHSVRDELLPPAKIFGLSDVRENALSLFQGWAWDKLFRADFVREHGLRFQGLRTTNDLLFVFSALVRAARISVLTETLVFQRREVLTSLSRTREYSWDNFLKALAALQEDLLGLGAMTRWRQDFINYALQLALWNLDTLQGPTFARLHEALTTRWLTELGISAEDPEVFYSAPEYERLLRLVTMPPDEFHGERDERPLPLTPAPARPGSLVPRYARATGPRISVIVPVYNAAKFLRLCLDSLLVHSGVDLEIVCVNDGSTDASREILQTYCESFENIIVVDRENGGLSAARNSGLDAATGEYVVFLDSDDLWRPVDVGALARQLVDDDLDVLLYDARSFRDPGVTTTTWKRYATYYERSRDYPVPTAGAQLLAAMRINHEYRVSACLYFMRREFLEDHGIRFIPNIIHEDNAFTFEVMLRAERAAHARVALYGRRVRAGSTMTGASHLRSMDGYLHAYRKMVELLNDHPCDDPLVAANLGGTTHQVLHNARHQLALAEVHHFPIVPTGAENDPLAHLAGLNMRRFGS